MEELRDLRLERVGVLSVVALSFNHREGYLGWSHSGP